MREFDDLLRMWLSGSLEKAEIRKLIGRLEQQDDPWPVYIEQLLNNGDISGMGTEAQKENIYRKLTELRFPTAQRSRKISLTYAMAGRVAAVVIVIVMAGIGYLWYHKIPEKKIIVRSPTVKEQVILPPGGNRAVLILGDGNHIVLDSSSKGKLATQFGTVIYKSDDGQIIYKKSNVQNGTTDMPVFNMLATPKGGQYKLVLPDGTKVWLNAESSIRYPSAFDAAERDVSITGEVYFEVAKDAVRPFHVKVNQMMVTVLGTHFNINAYSDEPSVNTTLLEGLVRIDNGTDHSMILPGQEARVDKTGGAKIISGIDTSQIIAWKNGYFYFDHTELQAVMRQLARWYNVTIEYKGSVPDMRFGGSIPRNADATEVLKILEKSDVHFVMEGNKIIVQ